MEGERSKVVIVSNDGKVDGISSGSRTEVIIKVPTYFIDCHTHIQSGFCAPLPILWDRLPGGIQLDRDTLNMVSYVLKPAAADIQVKPTKNIGEKLLEEMEGTFSNSGEIKSFYKDSDIFYVAVVMMMDMEYGWIEGYRGRRIYQEDDSKGRWYFYIRNSLKDGVEKWKKVYLPGDNDKKFKKWKTQYIDTQDAIINSALRLIGMYHYDPRRWNYSSREKVDKDLNGGPWDYPFSELVSNRGGGGGLFWGFKMYPPLGYKPLDSRLRFLYDSSIDGDSFYGRCEREKIPIMVHCSVGGIRSYEYNLYLEYDGEDVGVVVNEAISEETNRRFFTREGYFYSKYVHPWNWREVLDRYPKLKICFAHFGGDEWESGVESEWIKEIISLTSEYENVYTDLSCWDIDKVKGVFGDVIRSKRYVHLRDKILFGTDWYMPVIGGKSYRSFCEDFCEFFREIEGGFDLWERITFVNPVRFYGFFDKDEKGKDRIDYLYERLKKVIKIDGIKNKLEANYSFFRRGENRYKEIVEGRER